MMMALKPTAILDFFLVYSTYYHTVPIYLHFHDQHCQLRHPKLVTRHCSRHHFAYMNCVCVYNVGTIPWSKCGTCCLLKVSGPGFCLVCFIPRQPPFLFFFVLKLSKFWTRLYNGHVGTLSALEKIFKRYSITRLDLFSLLPTMRKTLS